MNRKLRALRQLNGMTQLNVAKSLGISPHTYLNKETGKTPFTIDEAKKLSDLFKAPIEDIFFKNRVINLVTKAI